MRKVLVCASAVAGLLSMNHAMAGEDVDVVYHFNIDDGQGMFTSTMDSAEAGFRLQDLETGETRNAVAVTGENVSVTRNDSTFDIDVDGCLFTLDQSLQAVYEPTPPSDSDATTPFGNNDARGPGQSTIIDRLGGLTGAWAGPPRSDDFYLEITAETAVVDDQVSVRRLIVKKKKSKKK